MDRCGKAPRLDSLPQSRRSLSVENLLRPERMSEANTHESIELTSALLCSDRYSATSGGSQQVPYHPQVGQRKLAQPSNNELARLDQASNDEQAQTGRESSDLQRNEGQPTQEFNNSCESAPLKPLLVTNKTCRVGRFGDWMWEIVSMVVAVCCLFAIFITLAKFDRQEQPNWLFAHTLNLSTLIALLATILRWMLENVLDAGIGQLKWRWFQTSPRPLNDMSIYENASRSIWGSLVFLFFLLRMNLATLGATMSVLSAVIGAFTQQAIQTVSCQKPVTNGQASIPIAQTFPQALSVSGAFASDVGLRASLIAGFAGLPSPNSLSPICPSGNCTFQATGGITYTAAGFSSECIDVSSLITQGGAHNWSPNDYDNDAQAPSTSYSLPNGQTIKYYLGTEYDDQRWDTMLMRTVGVLDMENVTMTERQRHIVSNSALHTNAEGANNSMIFLMPTASPCERTTEYQVYLGNEKWPMPPVKSNECPQLAHSLPGIYSIPGYFSVMAAICYYYPSIQNYNGSVINGKLEEQAIGDPIPLKPLGWDSIVESAPGRLNSTTPCNFLCGFADPCIVDNVIYTNTSENFTDVPGGLTVLANMTGPKRCLYGLSNDWSPVFAHSTFPIIILATNNLTAHQSETCKESANYTAMVCPRTWWLSSIYNGGNASVGSVDAFMKRGFGSLTAQLRTIGEDWDSNKTVAVGTSYETAVCIQFRWEWLLYPLAVVLGTLILLLAIISTSGFMERNREVIWKASILPFLFYGLEDGERKGGTELEPEVALKKTAQPLCVQLTSGDDGWRLHTS